MSRRVAIVGSGAAGLGAAWALAGRCEVELFEAAASPGGHVYTVAVPGERPAAVDMGFIVWNPVTYPHLARLLGALGVRSRPTSMSFSVRAGDGEFEYGSADLRALFARRRDLVRPRHWRLLGGIARLLRDGHRDLGGAAVGLRLDEYLAWRRVHADVAAAFVQPLASALWSMTPAAAAEFPAETFLRFLHQHGMLRPIGQLAWYTIDGGARRWVEALLARVPAALHLATPVAAIERDAAGVTLHLRDRPPRRFDRVVVATHADAALRLLADPDDDERRLLGAFRYSRNQAWLHVDGGALPEASAARASWNVLAGTITYWMNRLQGIAAPAPLCVTLNPAAPIAAAQVLHQASFEHPLFDFAARRAATELPRLQGRHRTCYAGAHLGFGFHEDALRSGLAAAARVLAAA
jgi:predicted NAD/FAD-binding protein